MKWPWNRDPVTDKDAEVLLAEANAASPTGPFRMVVDDVFSIAGRGTVVTGRIDTGTVRVGQPVRITRAGSAARSSTVTGVEMFRRIRNTASAGDDVGLLLAGVGKDDVARGDLLEG